MEWVVVFALAAFLIGILLIVRDATTYFEPPKKQSERRES